MTSRTDFAIALGLGGLLIIAGATIMVPGVTGVFHDDAVYVSTAKALATGQGYHLIDLPGAPPQTKYPILYPALLAIIWKIYPAFPENVAVMQWVTLVCGGAAMSLAYLYLVACAYAGRWAAGTAVAFSATTPFVAYIYGLTMSEALFSALIVGALWRMEWHLAQPSVSMRRSLVTGVALALPFLCRSPGVITIVAGLAILAWRRLPVGLVVAGVAGVSAPWMIWSFGGIGAWQADPISGYYADYVGAWTSLALPRIGQIIAWNAFALFHATASLPLEGSLAMVRDARLLVQIALALGAAVWVWTIWSARAGRPLAIFLTLYAAILLPWPWPPARFLLPVLPLVLGVALGGLGKHVWRARTLPAQWLALTGFVVLFLPNVLWFSMRSALNHEFGYPYYSHPAEPAHWQEYPDLFDWIRSHTDETDVLASPLDSMVSLYTGRKAFRPFVHRPDLLFYGAPGPAVGTGSDLTRALMRGGSRYLVVVPMFQFSEAPGFGELLALTTADGLFEVVHEGRDHRFKVLRRNSSNSTLP